MKKRLIALALLLCMLFSFALAEDEDDFEWPDWAKDWPRVVTNFWLDQDGVHWGYWAGEIFAGCNGHMTISLTWDQLKPIVRKDFIVPSK